MNVLILGGESPRHHQWVRDAAASLQPVCSDVRYQDYTHWETGASSIDLGREIARAAELTAGLESYRVVAKSIGTVVATLAVGRGLLHPERCVFLGFPVEIVVARLPEVGKAMQGLPQTTFVHNEFDTVGSVGAVRDYLDEVEPPEYSLRTVAGNTTHDYLDFDFIATLVAN